jgi:hypothetical protein
MLPGPKRPPDRARRHRRRAVDDDARTDDPLADPLHPDDAVGVEHHLDDARVIEQIGKRSERALERAGAPRLALGQLGLSVRRHLRSSIGAPQVLRRIDMRQFDCAGSPPSSTGI